MKVLHVITGLNQGGAERQLTTLVGASGRENAVFSMLSPGVMGAPIRGNGIPLFSGRVRKKFSPMWIPRLRKALVTYQPDVVMGWMYHGNLAASMTRLMGHRGAVLWNVRHSVGDLRREKAMTRWAIRAGARLCRVPGRIVYNSATAALQHEALGYDSSKTIVIPNGVDTDRFRPNDSVRWAQRGKWGVPEEGLLLGVVGRSHAMKNHAVWLRAFASLAQDRPDVFCAIVGRGVPAALGGLVKQLALQERVFLSEGVMEPENLYPAFDLLVLPSAWGEGFSNVLGEAMACGIPAIATPVGDSARIVAGSGSVAPDWTMEGLEKALRDTLSLGKGELRRRGQLARESMVDRYTVGAMVGLYDNMLESCR
ncbi:glycosyltransferase [Thioalkalivibrio sp. ALJ24]|uniref:glycosyltransferase n=1 Tax=Thioalkalivibrio sp. ALJ24 TaxID=545276 RepID=UPI000475F055|nr:glycosyltransferase [Thioalkalivibrio sp. ALJ24]